MESTTTRENEMLIETQRGIRRHALLTKPILSSLPPLYAQDGKGMDATCYVKFFYGGRGAFFATEFDGDDTLYGYCVSPLGPDCDEFGYASFRELETAKGRFGIPAVERDCYWGKPRTVAQALTDDHITVAA